MIKHSLQVKGHVAGQLSRDHARRHTQTAICR